MQKISVKTQHRTQLIDVTNYVRQAVDHSGISQGLVIAYVPHTTAAITINENADPSVVHDLLLTLEELVPQHHSGYRHSEGNSDAHVKASLVGSSVAVIVETGHLQLGTWQGIYFCEFDGPRHRSLLVHLHPVADMLHHLQIMGDEEIGEVEASLEITQEINDLSLDGHVESAYRLVADEKPRLHREGPRDADPLALPP